MDTETKKYPPTCVIYQNHVIVGNRSKLYIQTEARELIEDFEQIELQCTIQQYHSLPNIREKYPNVMVARITEMIMPQPRNTFQNDIKLN